MKRFIHILLFTLLAVTTLAQGKAKYIFYFIGDGMGVNQVNATEMYMADKDENRTGIKPLHFTQFPVINIATTFSATNSVTDSSAAGTALATGKKTYNGAIGLDDRKQPLTSVAEMAKRSGKKVGITTSVSVDHATPAAFYAHQADRNMYYEIALDLPKAGFDFYAGGGFLKPNTTYDKKEAPSVFPVFEAAGYTVARGYNDFKAKAPSAKKMILIEEEGMTADTRSLYYAIDRNTGNLTLPQITESAVSFLTTDNNKGFFLMVEGGMIDWACHDNDAATVFGEIADMDNAIQIACEFYKKHPKETLIVVTADHETGGIGLGKGGDMNLKALKHQKQSAWLLSTHITELRKQKGHKTTWEEVKELLGRTMGFWTELPIEWEHEKMLRDCYEASFSKKAQLEMEKSLYTISEPLVAKAKEVLNDIAGVGWISGGHTAGYVPVYAIGAGSELFNGKMDNTDIPKRIAKAGGYK